MNETLWEFCIKIFISIILTKAVELIFVKTRNIRKSIKANLYFLAAVLIFSLALFSLPFILNKLPPYLFILVYGTAFLTSYFFGFLYYRRITIEKDLLNFIAQTGKKIKDVAASPDLEETDRKRKQQLYACTRVLRTVIHEIELEFTRNFKRGKFGNPTGSTAGSAPAMFKEFEAKLAAIYNQAIAYIHKTVFNPGTGESDYEVYTDSGLMHKPVGEPRYRWLLDPVDGVYHFHNQVPLYTTCAALQEKCAGGWKTLLGVIYIPITREFFFAINGEGSYLNDWNHILDISRQDIKKEDMLFHFEFPNLNSPAVEYKQSCAFLESVLCKARRTRGLGLGSWGMAYTAKGAFHTYLTLSGGTQIYDIIAGKLLVECAGGKVIIEPCKQESRIPNPLPDLPGIVKVFAANEITYNKLKEDLKILFESLP